jgi:hypothetical protein
MNDELERLRDVARALVAESQAWAAQMGHLADQRAQGLFDIVGDREAARLGRLILDRTWDLDQAMARLAEVNPELVTGYQRKANRPPRADHDPPL